MKWKERKGRKGGGRERKTKRKAETSITEIKTWFDFNFLFLQGGEEEEEEGERKSLVTIFRLVMASPRC